MTYNVITIDINDEKKTLTAEGHAENLACASVTLLFDVLYALLKTKKMLFEDGLSSLTFSSKKDYETAKDLVSSLAMKYPAHIKLNKTLEVIL